MFGNRNLLTCDILASLLQQLCTSPCHFISCCMTMPIQLSTPLTVFYSADVCLHLQAVSGKFAMVAVVLVQ